MTGRPPAGLAPRYPRARLRHRVLRVVPLLGPAFVAFIAYVDPGNFATNVQGGAEHGYLLLWVILAANLMAMPVQHLSSKLGIATGHGVGIGFSVGGAAHGLVPGFDSSGTVLLATGILGATVMPHVVYLHSALTNDRAGDHDGERRRMLRITGSTSRRCRAPARNSTAWRAIVPR